jgi:hypothetical protein
VPQIWLSDEELGAMFGCSRAVARDRSIAHGWARRRSMDGLSRTKLPQEMFEEFLLDYAARLLAKSAADSSVAQLRGMLASAQRFERYPDLRQDNMAA